MNRAIHAIRTVCVALAILSLALFIFVRLDYLERVQLQGPKITMDSETVTISVHDGNPAILAGITATDSGGKDVSDLLQVESLGKLIAPSTREATIAAFDRAGNVTKAIRTIVYSDYTSPRLSLSGPLVSTPAGSSAMLERISIPDCLDGDLSGQMSIIMNDPNNVSYVGEFPVTLQATNSAGDTISLPLTMEYYSAAEERTRPDISLLEYLVYTRVGAVINPEAYLSGLTMDGKSYYYDQSHDSFVQEGNTYQQAVDAVEDDLLIPVSWLEITEPAPFSEPGVYEIEYRCVSSAGVAGTVRLIVIVEQSGG